MKTMKTKISVAALLFVVAPFGLAACAGPPTTPSEVTYEDEDFPYVDEEKAYVYSDENSVVKEGDNGVRTITVTLNNGTKVECVEYTTLVCFPELISPR